MSDLCRVPIRASYAVVDGKAQRISAEYAEIPAQMIADFFLQHFGVPIPAEREDAKATYSVNKQVNLM